MKKHENNLNFINMKEKYSKVAEVKNEKTVTTHKHGFFTIIDDNGKFKIAVQQYLVSSKTFDKLEDAKKYCNSKPWELIINVTSLANNLVKNEESKKS